MIVLLSDEWYFATSNKLFVAMSNKKILHWLMSDFLQRATSAMSNKQILQQVTSDFLQQATSATSEWIFATSKFCNE